MDKSYLYEIGDISEDHAAQQHPMRKTFSEEEDEEIWEVPEESFENAYQQVVNDDDDDEVEEIAHNQQWTTGKSNEINKNESSKAELLHLSLNSEQIALKVPQQQSFNSQITTFEKSINKSMNADTDVTRPMTVNTNITNVTAMGNTNTTTSSGGGNVKWKNIKINESNHKSEQQKKSLSLGIIRPMNNIETISKSSPSNGGKSLTISNKSHEATRKYSLGSAPYCPSPEFVLENILKPSTSIFHQQSNNDGRKFIEESDRVTPKDNNPFKMNSPSPKLVEYKRVQSDITSVAHKCQIHEQPYHHHQHHQHQWHSKPSIVVTRTSSSSLSGYHNPPKYSASTETFETASIISRNSTHIPLEMTSTTPSTQIPPILLCSLCKEIFKDPRCLNCLHTFCLECIVEESFKQDEEECSNPFISNIPTLQQHQQSSSVSKNGERNVKATCSPSPSRKYSTPLTSLELKLENKNAEMTGSSTVSLQKRPSFSFKLRRSSEQSPARIKVDSNRISPDFTAMMNQFQTLGNIKCSRIKCKLCQFATDIPVGGLRQLPRNLLMVRKIEQYRNKIASENYTLCSLCYEETRANYFCETCNLNLCILCKDSHERQKPTANHALKTLTIDLKSNAEAHSKTTPNDNHLTLTCCLHPGFELKSFCHTCLQVACSDCLILQHKGHRIDSTEKAAKVYSSILHDSAEQTRLICKSAEHSLEKLNASMLSINRKCDELQTEIEDFMQRYKDAVELHRLNLMQQIRRTRETKLELIGEQQTELEKRTQEGQIAIGFSQELTDVSTDVEILSFIKILLKRFEYCQQFKASVDPKIINIPNFLPKIQAPMVKDSNDIPVFGILSMQTVEPSLCTLQWDGFSQLRINKKVELTLISRDAEGQPMTHGGLKIQTHVKYKDLNSKCLRMEVTDNCDGTYGIAFTPDAEGTIILMITIKEKHIKGSPFSFLARPVRPHTGIYHCCTFCSSKGNKFATCSCQGSMPGYSGCGHGHTGHPGRRHWSCCGEVSRNSECHFANRSLNPK
ncbi:uncharacterized protein LOC105262023 isoform X2 [Musca domestica]|uniref:Uncharacterized protein LOC105262023 isoform X2 n=2 Tax=Musca domestica TaxID=7370 RepID=A0ABM3V4K4_MUSDO|nr:uncharacterized protein LOC105262023 isoform X2 [Musca domestica]